MNNDTMQTTNSSDEIDLSLLGLRLINALQRSFKIFVGIIVLGALLGLGYFYLTPPTYETSMIASSKVLTIARIESLIKVLNDLASEKNGVEIAKKLQLSLGLAQKISSIKAESIIDANGKEKSGDDKSLELDNKVFVLRLSVLDNRQMDSLQAGILYYLQHNDYVQKRTAIQKQNLEIMRERLKEEVKKLDSLRFSVNKLLSKGIGNNSTMLMSDPASVNKDIIALYDRELTINSELLLINDIQVIQDFTQFTKPVSPKLLKSIAASTGSAVTLAFILIAILEVRRGMRKLKQELEQKVTREKELV